MIDHVDMKTHVMDLAMYRTHVKCAMSKGIPHLEHNAAKILLKRSVLIQSENSNLHSRNEQTQVIFNMLQYFKDIFIGFEKNINVKFISFSFIVLHHPSEVSERPKVQVKFNRFLPQFQQR